MMDDYEDHEPHEYVEYEPVSTGEIVRDVTMFVAVIFAILAIAWKFGLME